MNKVCKSPRLFALVLGLVAPALALAGDPTDQLRETTEKILAIVQNPDLNAPDKVLERQKRMKKVVDQRFDWASMARSAMGRYWRDLSDAQRADFTAIFSELIEKTYMTKVEGYSGEKILYRGDKVDGAYGVVDVAIVTLRGANISVSYRVLQKGEEWLVYDVSIEGVSLVNNYRSQIGSILNRSSYGELMDRLRAKVASLTEQGETQAGTPPPQGTGKDTP